MLKLEELAKDAQITGLIPDEVVKVVNVEEIGPSARLVAYRNAQGTLDEQTIFRHDEHRFSLAVAGKAWAFDAAPAAFNRACRCPARAPNVIGGALINPGRLLAQRSGLPNFSVDAAARARIQRIAMQAVFDAEHALGHRTKGVSFDKCGWDIAAYIEQAEGLALERHIEVKGRAKGQDTITVTSNEIRHGLNQKDKFVLAVVVVDGDSTESVNYVPMPFTQEPDWAKASKNLDLGLLLQRARSPLSFNA